MAAITVVFGNMLSAHEKQDFLMAEAVILLRFTSRKIYEYRRSHIARRDWISFL